MSTIYDGNPNGTSTSSSLPWLCFTSVEDGSTVAMELIGSTHQGLDLDVSFDGGQTWTAWDLSTITLNYGDRMWLRGDNTCTAQKNGSVDCFSTFVMTGKIKASGSVMSLLYRNDPLSDTFPNYTSTRHGFANLFDGCTALLTPPDLPGMKSANRAAPPDWCYRRMFMNCTNLQYAPRLPMKDGSSYCYSYMFAGCISLVKAPEIELERHNSSYTCNGMFVRCTGLKTPPSVLKPTQLYSYTYNNMFSYCTSLVSAPKIMATNIADNSFSSMFRQCTSLKKAPTFKSLSGTNFNYCFSTTFYSCTALEEVQDELIIERLGARTFENTFYGCIALKKLPSFKILNSLTSTGNAYCFYYTFAYCYAATNAPKIDYPVDGMITGAMFSYMFYFCTSLKKTPALPWTNFNGTGQYSYMFYNCVSLEEVPEVLPLTTLTGSCYAYMFGSCFSLKTPPRLPATTIAASCYASMFSSCRMLDKLPELPATTLFNSCYNNMFYGAGTYAQLSHGTVDVVLPALELPTGNAYYNMFYNCPLIRSLDMKFKTCGNQSLTTANKGITSMCCGASYIKWIKIAFTEWGTSNWRANWCNGAYAYATLYKPRALPDIAAGNSSWIATWTVVDYNPPEE